MGEWRMRLKRVFNACPTLRIPSVVRTSLTLSLAPILASLDGGRLLDVGAKAAPYRRLVECTDYVTLDICPEARPDICCDIHDIAAVSGSFDSVIAQVLEHLREPQRAVTEIHRVLKAGGALVASTRFINCYHPDPHDYYRFTADSLAELCSGFQEVRIRPHGNALQAVWHLVNNDYRAARVLLNVLNPLIARIRRPSERLPLGYIVVARK